MKFLNALALPLMLGIPIAAGVYGVRTLTPYTLPWCGSCALACTAGLISMFPLGNLFSELNDKFWRSRRGRKKKDK